MSQALQDQYDEFPGFDTCIALIRSDDPGTAEDGYFWLEGRAGQYAHQLISLVEAEPDSFIRSYFVELLAAAKDPNAIPTLISEMSHPNQQVRYWAVTGLEEIGSEREQELARAHKAAHPDEW